MSDHDVGSGKIQHARRSLLKAGSAGLAAFLAQLIKPRPAAASPPCFLKGTTIRTGSGDVKVEDLVVGDMLPSAFGGTQSVQWIGRYSYKRSDPAKRWVQDVLPVRIARSALGPDVPHADLFVTRGHALLIDGCLVPAGSLVNGATIAFYDAEDLDELEYFHIKLERHDVIFAQGAPCETLLTVDERAVNFAEYFRTYGEPDREAATCAPLMSFNGARSEIKSRLRSALAPWIDRRGKLDIIRDRLEQRAL